MARKAFIIGINTHGLQYAHNDAALMEECLKKYKYDVYIPTVPDKWKLLRQFETWVNACNKTDICIFYFSGHGIISRGKLYIVLDNNTNSLNIDFMFTLFEECKAKDKLVILDCCHAGTTHADWTPNLSDSYRLLTASERLEKSKEFDNLNASFLTHHLSQALKTPSELLVDEKGSISINALGAWLENQAKEYNGKHNVPIPIPNLLGNHKIDITLAIVHDFINKERKLDRLISSELNSTHHFSIEELVRHKLKKSGYITDDEFRTICKNTSDSNDFYPFNSYYRLIDDYLNSLRANANFKDDKVISETLYRRMLNNIRQKKVRRNLILLENTLNQAENRLLYYIYKSIVEIELSKMLNLYGDAQKKIDLISPIIKSYADEDYEIFKVIMKAYHEVLYG